MNTTYTFKNKHVGKPVEVLHDYISIYLQRKLQRDGEENILILELCRKASRRFLGAPRRMSEKELHSQEYDRWYLPALRWTGPLIYSQSCQSMNRRKMKQSCVWVSLTLSHDALQWPENLHFENLWFSWRILTVLFRTNKLPLRLRKPGCACLHLELF